jgi:protein TonB
MEPNQIKDADILDILFEGRNKEYGAYELRKTYNRRIVKAIFVTGSLIGLLFVGGYVAGRNGGKVKVPKYDDADRTLVDIKEPDKPLPLPPPIKPPPPQVAMQQFTPPRIVKDQEVKQNEKPPENDKLDDVKIGAETHTGAADDGIAGPPVDAVGKGVVEAPKKEEDDAPFMRVEVDASFPGGPAAWLRFMNKNLRYPDEAMNNGIQGTVMVQFIVDKEGNVSDVQAISGPEQGGLREEAIRVIKKSGKWTPALQNGRYVKAYRRQPVTFQVGADN